MSRAWMPLYVADYLADTTHLSLLQSGAYLHLIMHYWQHGALPREDVQLAAIVRMNKREWGAIKPVISSFFQDGWIHKRIEFELASANASYERRAMAGKKGGNALSARKQCYRNVTGNGAALLKQSQSQKERGLSGKTESIRLESNCPDHDLDHSGGEP